ncbi:MAG: endonuclease [Succinivibrio sp.]
MNFFTKALLLVQVLAFTETVLALDHDVYSFRNTKKEMLEIFKKLESPKTLYCNCDIDFKEKGWMVNLQSCGYKVRKDTKRASRIEAEHIMPAWEFGHEMNCWKKGKRKGCEISDSNYKVMENDLHNLYPAVGEVNADRSNFKFSRELKGTSPYGRCQVIIDRKRQRVSIPDNAKGVVARAYLYMSQRYNIALDSEHINLFNEWNNRYKPSKNECLRNRLIESIQGNDNPFVTGKCK